MTEVNYNTEEAYNAPHIDNTSNYSQNYKGQKQVNRFKDCHKTSGIVLSVNIVPRSDKNKEALIRVVINRDGPYKRLISLIAYSDFGVKMQENIQKGDSVSFKFMARSREFE